MIGWVHLFLFCVASVSGYKRTVECIDSKEDFQGFSQWSSSSEYLYAGSAEDLPCSTILDICPRARWQGTESLDGEGIFYFIANGGDYNFKREINQVEPCYLYARYYGTGLGPEDYMYINSYGDGDPSRIPLPLTSNLEWEAVLVNITTSDGVKHHNDVGMMPPTVEEVERICGWRNEPSTSTTEESTTEESTSRTESTSTTEESTSTTEESTSTTEGTSTTEESTSTTEESTSTTEGTSTTEESTSTTEESTSITESTTEESTSTTEESTSTTESTTTTEESTSTTESTTEESSSTTEESTSTTESTLSSSTQGDQDSTTTSTEPTPPSTHTPPTTSHPGLIVTSTEDLSDDGSSSTAIIVVATVLPVLAVLGVGSWWLHTRNKCPAKLRLPRTKGAA